MSRISFIALFALALATAREASACHVVADAGGPYVGECGEPIQLDGSKSGTCRSDPVYFAWSSDCPGGSFDDPTIAKPLFTLDGPPPCPVECEITLDVSDDTGFHDHHHADVTVVDTRPPELIARLEPVAPRAPRGPTSACSAPAAARVRVVCDVSDACDPAPSLDLTLVAISRSAASPMVCIEERVEHAVACDEILDVVLVDPPCLGRAPRAPRGAAGASSLRTVVAERVVLVAKASDVCGNASELEFNPAAGPCPIVAPPRRGCRVPLCGAPVRATPGRRER